MFGLIRFFIGLVFLGALIWCGATVKLGKRTTFGHISAIWGSSEGKDLRDGVSEKAKDVKQTVRKMLDDPAAPDAGVPHHARP